MDDIYQKYDAVLRENEQLKQELKRLKMQIGQFTPQAAEDHPAPPASPQEQSVTYGKEQKERVHQFSSVEEKIALYRSYFRGRDDVKLCSSMQADCTVRMPTSRKSRFTITLICRCLC